MKIEDVKYIKVQCVLRSNWHDSVARPLMVILYMWVCDKDGDHVNLSHVKDRVLWGYDDIIDRDFYNLLSLFEKEEEKFVYKVAENMHKESELWTKLHLKEFKDKEWINKYSEFIIPCSLFKVEDLEEGIEAKFNYAFAYFHAKAEWIEAVEED